MGDTVKVVGIKYKTAGRVYYFDPAGIELKAKDCVVVSTPRGLKLGEVAADSREIAAAELTEPLKPVVRKATPEDIKKAEEFSGKEIEVLSEATSIVSRLNLPMKLIMAEYNLEGNHLTIYFKAAERVDFRELVKELNSYFHLRVELRQVGPRDEAKLVGGYGRCGRPLCCASFLSEFVPVSIKMAKQQNLPLNPMKIAGSCGRLLCCLAYEAEPSQRPPARPVKVTGEASIEEAPIEEEIQATEEAVVADIPVNDVPAENRAEPNTPEKTDNHIDDPPNQSGTIIEPKNDSQS